MRTDDFDYELPERCIAQAPLEERDASRLMLLPRDAGPPSDHGFLDLPELLQPGDLLVLNDVRVIPARVFGRKAESGGAVEVLLIEVVEGRRWGAMCRASKRPRPGQGLDFGEVQAEVCKVEDGGLIELVFDRDPPAVLAWLESGGGEVPLPPYIRRGSEPSPVDDRLRYQTVYARTPGAVAAPTAGLHFTPRVFARLRARGIGWASVTLYVGPGTFLPVRAEHIEAHVMHEERWRVPEATARRIAEVRAQGGRIVAVGTTALRTLEAAADPSGVVVPGEGRTDLFIRPGYRFRAIDGLVTNFHLPRSTLLMLVSALAGRERVLAAYRHAIESGYRFYSYGDAMLIL
ncbi:MAG: tRNA preQ1(34) S-adenosylmethionine ribosyltransferase-isomerase QueA [Deltaproteobacteria bacterium]|nr:MAG: tRNA preQ1(34) S-adenosylmethionine ribosyltransferase-isomerase QueA [Deltaproteobacteria bacterium]